MAWKSVGSRQKVFFEEVKNRFASNCISYVIQFSVNKSSITGKMGKSGYVRTEDKSTNFMFICLLLCLSFISTKFSRLFHLQYDKMQKVWRTYNEISIILNHFKMFKIATI